MSVFEEYGSFKRIASVLKTIITLIDQTEVSQGVFRAHVDKSVHINLSRDLRAFVVYLYILQNAPSP